MTAGHAVLVAVAGIVGGAINAVAGGGTLVTFPALLGVGMDPVLANITSSVGLLTGYAGGSVAYRQELAGQGDRGKKLAAVSVVGGVAGAVILLVTPARSFRVAAPFLILASCGLLAVQPRLSRFLDRRWRITHPPAASTDASAPPAGVRPPAGHGWAAQVGVGVGAVYGSYFGAGLGVLLIAVLALLIDEDLQRLNALKGLLSLVINAVGVVVFLVAGRVAWRYAAILAVCAYLGGTLGVRVARRLSPRVLRAGVVCLGLAVAASLLATG